MYSVMGHAPALRGRPQPSRGGARPAASARSGRLASRALALLISVLGSGDIPVLLLQLMIIPSNHLSRMLAMRACRTPGAAHSGHLSFAEAGPESAKAEAQPLSSRPALKINDFDERTLLGFPCQSCSLVRVSYTFFRFYPFHFRTVSYLDASEPLYVGAMLLALFVLLLGRFVPALLLPLQHRYSMRRSTSGQQQGGRASPASPSSSASTAAAAAAAAAAAEEQLMATWSRRLTVVRHLALANVRLALSLGYLLTPVMFWRQYGRQVGAMLLPLSCAKYLAAGSRWQGCMFAALSATIFRVPLRLHVITSALDGALMLAATVMGDLMTHGSFQQPVTSTLAIFGCIVLAPIAIHPWLHDPHAVRRGDPRVTRPRAPPLQPPSSPNASGSTSTFMSPPPSPVKPSRLAPTSPRQSALQAGRTTPMSQHTLAGHGSFLLLLSSLGSAAGVMYLLLKQALWTCTRVVVGRIGAAVGSAVGSATAAVRRPRDPQWRQQEQQERQQQQQQGRGGPGESHLQPPAEPPPADITDSNTTPDGGGEGQESGYASSGLLLPRRLSSSSSNGCSNGKVFRRIGTAAAAATAAAASAAAGPSDFHGPHAAAVDGIRPPVREGGDGGGGSAGGASAGGAIAASGDASRSTDVSPKPSPTKTPAAEVVTLLAAGASHEDGGTAGLPATRATTTLSRDNRSPGGAGGGGGGNIGASGGDRATALRLNLHSLVVGVNRQQQQPLRGERSLAAAGFDDVGSETPVAAAAGVPDMAVETAAAAALKPAQLYKSRRGTCVVSVKVHDGVLGGGSFPQTAALVARAARSALHATNEQLQRQCSSNLRRGLAGAGLLAAAEPAGPLIRNTATTPGVSGGGGGGGSNRSPALGLCGGVVVPGCVHLILTLRMPRVEDDDRTGVPRSWVAGGRGGSGRPDGGGDMTTAPLLLPAIRGGARVLHQEVTSLPPPLTGVRTLTLQRPDGVQGGSGDSDVPYDIARVDRACGETLEDSIRCLALRGLHGNAGGNSVRHANTVDDDDLSFMYGSAVDADADAVICPEVSADGDDEHRAEYDGSWEDIRVLPCYLDAVAIAVPPPPPPPSTCAVAAAPLPSPLLPELAVSAATRFFSNCSSDVTVTSAIPSVATAAAATAAATDGGGDVLVRVVLSPQAVAAVARLQPPPPPPPSSYERTKKTANATSERVHPRPSHDTYNGPLRVRVVVAAPRTSILAAVDEELVLQPLPQLAGSGASGTSGSGGGGGTSGGIGSVAVDRVSEPAETGKAASWGSAAAAAAAADTWRHEAPRLLEVSDHSDDTWPAAELWLKVPLSASAAVAGSKLKPTAAVPTAAPTPTASATTIAASSQPLSVHRTWPLHVILMAPNHDVCSDGNGSGGAAAASSPDTCTAVSTPASLSSSPSSASPSHSSQKYEQQPPEAHRVLASLPLLLTEDPDVAAELNAAYDHHTAALSYAAAAAAIRHASGDSNCKVGGRGGCGGGRHVLPPYDQQPYNASRLAAYQDHMSDLVTDVEWLLQPPMPALPSGACDGFGSGTSAVRQRNFLVAECTRQTLAPPPLPLPLPLPQPLQLDLYDNVASTIASAAAALPPPQPTENAVEDAVATGEELLSYMRNHGMGACCDLILTALRERWGVGAVETAAPAAAPVDEGCCCLHQQTQQRHRSQQQDVRNDVTSSNNSNPGGSGSSNAAAGDGDGGCGGAPGPYGNGVAPLTLQLGTQRKALLTPAAAASVGMDGTGAAPSPPVVAAAATATEGASIASKPLPQAAAEDAAMADDADGACSVRRRGCWLPLLLQSDVLKWGVLMMRHLVVSKHLLLLSATHEPISWYPLATAAVAVAALAPLGVLLRAPGLYRTQLTAITLWLYELPMQVLMIVIAVHLTYAGGSSADLPSNSSSSSRSPAHVSQRVQLAALQFFINPGLLGLDPWVVAGCMTLRILPNIIILTRVYGVPTWLAAVQSAAALAIAVAISPVAGCVQGAFLQRQQGRQ